MNQQDVRATAAKVIAAVEHGESLASVLPDEEAHIDEKHLPLLRQLCYGTLRHYYSLSHIRKQLVRKPLKAKESTINALLLVGLYQLAYSRVPSHAAVAETVNATLTLQKSWAKGLVNAVLRSMQRQKDSLLAQVKETCTSCYEHPQWLLDAYQKHWPHHWQHIVQVSNEQAPMTLRVNLQRHTRDHYRHLLQEKSLQEKITPLSPAGITLEKACNVRELPGFNKGWVSVQDEAAQLGALLLDCQPGHHVLDLCAAPGGKTCHLLEHTDNLNVWAVDIDAHRLSRVQENLDRLQLNAHLICGNAEQPETWWNGDHFDRILVDAPCSATGVIRRHPDIKLLRRKEDINQLAVLQYSILKKAWALLKPGGLLVYATCSIMPEENSQQIKRFINEHNDVKLHPIVLNHHKMHTIIDTDETFGIQLLPTKGNHDGFFYSILAKHITK